MTELDEASAAWAAATHIYFHGVVHPIDGAWYFEVPISFTADNQRFSIALRSSGLRVLVNGPTDLGAEDFYAQVRGHVQGTIDALGYALGAHLTAEIQGGYANTPDGRQLTLDFQHRWRDLPGQSKSDEAQAAELAPLVTASLESPLLRAALSDLANAMSDSTDTSFHAYRTIETVRHWLYDEVGLEARPASRADEWSLLHATLGTTKGEFTDLLRRSERRRHGELIPTTGAEREADLSLARDVFQRAVEFRQTLPIVRAAKIKVAVKSPPASGNPD